MLQLSPVLVTFFFENSTNPPGSLVGIQQVNNHHRVLLQADGQLIGRSMICLSQAERKGSRLSAFQPLPVSSTYFDNAAAVIHQLSVSEHIRFTHAYYVLWKLSLSAKSTHHDLLAATNLRELLYLADLGRQISMNFPRDQQAQIDFQPKSWLLVYYLL